MSPHPATPLRRTRPGAHYALTLLLAVAAPLAACGQSGDAAAGPAGLPPGSAGGTPGTPGAPSGSAVPRELVGQWYAGTASPTDYFDPNTGHWSGNGEGKGVLYTFTADDHYTYAFQVTSRTYNCYTLTLFYVKGDLRVDPAAGTYDLRPTSGRRIERSNCGGGNGETPLDGVRESGYYRLRRDAGTTWLDTRPLDGGSGWAPMRRFDE